MRRVLKVILVVCGIGAFPAAVSGQDVALNRATVEACFDATPVGSVDPSCLGAASNACQSATPRGETTIGIAECIQAETQVWDDLLNREYQATRQSVASDDAVREQLLTAQRAWIAFRDAECALAYARWRDGSIRVIVAANCLMVQTARRTFELRDMREY